MLEREPDARALGRSGWRRAVDRDPAAAEGDRQETLEALLDRYNVRYVVVSDLERRTYGDAASTRFEPILPVAFRSGSVTIYRVP